MFFQHLWVTVKINIGFPTSVWIEANEKSVILDRKMTYAVYDQNSPNINQTFHLLPSKLM